VLDKAEVAEFTSLAEGLGTNEIDVVKIAIVDYVAVAEHRAEPFKESTLSELVPVKALQRLEMIAILRIILVPGIFPSLSGAILESERDDLFHDGKETRHPGQLLKGLWCKRCPHVGGNQFKSIFRTPAMTLEHLIDSYGRKDVAQVAVVAFVFIFLLLSDQFLHSSQYSLLFLGRKL